MGLFDFIKPVATIALGRGVRKGIKSGVKGAIKGIKRSGSSIKKGIKSATRGVEKAVGGVKEAVKTIPRVREIINLGRIQGFKNQADTTKNLLMNAYKIGSRKVAKGQKLKDIMRIAEETKGIRNLVNLEKAIGNMAKGTRDSRSWIQSISKGLGRLAGEARNAGVDTASSTAFDYALGRGIQLAGGGLISGGTTAGGVALGNKLSN